MSDYPFISDYRHIEKYRESFNELAKQIFKLDFKEWYGKGFWDDSYVCYSYLDEERIIANASITKMVLTINGKDYRAIQVGTVMTHPDYRNQGLSAKLMDHILEQYEKKVDFIFLFANDTVLEFYPRFGFEKVRESSFSLKASDLSKQTAQPSALRKLDVDNEADFMLMKEFAAERKPVSSKLGVKGNDHLLMFYFILVFPDAAYYDQAADAIVLFEREGNELHVFDIVSKKPIDLEKVINRLISDDTANVRFYFMPDSGTLNIESAFITETNDTLFVRPSTNFGTEHFTFPLTAHT